MARGGSTLNITLDREYPAKSTRLAERTHVPEGTLARSLLSRAIDDAEVGADHVMKVLDSISGAFERAQLGFKETRSKQAISLDEL